MALLPNALLFSALLCTIFFLLSPVLEKRVGWRAVVVVQSKQRDDQILCHS